MNDIALTLRSKWLLRRIVQKHSHSMAEFTWGEAGEQALDQVVLQCALSESQFRYLRRYQNALAQKQNVKVEMDAEYVRFGAAFSGQTPECAGQMILIEGAIKSINHIEVDFPIHL